MENIIIDFIEIILPFLAIVSIFILIIYNFILNYNTFKNSSYCKITGNSFWKVFYDLGARGEYVIYKKLSELELSGAKFLFNLYLPKKNGKTSEIDVLIIHPKGLFVIESKNYSGWIFGNEKQRQWTQTLPISYGLSHKEYFYNPILQNQTHIRALRPLINDNIPIYSIIAFSDNCTLKKVTVNSDVLVTQYDKLRYELMYRIGNLQPEILNEIEIEEIYEKLLPYSQVTNDVKIQHIKNINLNNKEIFEEDNNEEEHNNSCFFPIIIILCIIAFCIFNSLSPKEDLSVEEIYQNYNESLSETIIIPERTKIESYSLEPLETIDNEEIIREDIKLEKKRIRQIKKEQKRQLKAERKQLKSEIKALKKAIKEQEKNRKE